MWKALFITVQYNILQMTLFEGIIDSLLPTTQLYGLEQLAWPTYSGASKDGRCGIYCGGIIWGQNAEADICLGQVLLEKNTAFFS